MYLNRPECLNSLLAVCTFETLVSSMEILFLSFDEGITLSLKPCNLAKMNRGDLANSKLLIQNFKGSNIHINNMNAAPFQIRQYYRVKGHEGPPDPVIRITSFWNKESEKWEL
jgi:hypothetical protein